MNIQTVWRIYRRAQEISRRPGPRQEKAAHLAERCEVRIGAALEGLSEEGGIRRAWVVRQYERLLEESSRAAYRYNDVIFGRANGADPLIEQRIWEQAFTAVDRFAEQHPEAAASAGRKVA